MLNPLIYSTENFPIIRPLLRITTKYSVLRIRAAIVEAIEMRYPIEWLKTPAIFTATLPRISSTVHLAYECSLYQTLPWILYYASRSNNNLKGLASTDLALIHNGRARMLVSMRNRLLASQGDLQEKTSACASSVHHTFTWL